MTEPAGPHDADASADADTNANAQAPARRARGKDARLSTPVVLAASSAMLAVGIVAWLGVSMSGSGGDVDPDMEDPEGEYVALSIDDRTPHRVAESYLDAWRRRAWDSAASISVGEAHERALAKRLLDAEIDPVDRVMAREVWERLAGAPLTVEFTDSERTGEHGVATDIVLEGVASYDFMSEPYRREVRWVVRPEGELWRVVSMENGRVLTEIPDLLRGSEL